MTGAGAERGERSAEEEVAGPEREIEAFVKARWPEEGADGGWETLWYVVRSPPEDEASRIPRADLSGYVCRFANPPSLQSVRGLAHFHVLAQRKQDGERRNEA